MGWLRRGATVMRQESRRASDGRMGPMDGEALDLAKQFRLSASVFGSLHPLLLLAHALLDGLDLDGDVGRALGGGLAWVS